MTYDNLSWAEYYHILVNIEDYPDFAPKARELALGFFSQAVYDQDPHYAPFVYSAAALDERMMWIYDDYVAGMENEHWLDSGSLGEMQVGRFSDAAVIENLRQKAPFNLVDGAWLRNIMNTGPCNQVQANLFAIWADEAGNGRTELNHCNVYDTLLRSLNIYLPPIVSREFIQMDFLPSAYDNAVFQMSVGLSPQEFFPELLGMTLYLEWEATPTLTPAVRLLEGRKIDASFYRLHVAIDNIASGHGAMAKEAVKLYLDDVREKGGEVAVQAYWRRIWNGYVTWATTGTFGFDLLNYLLLFDGKLPDERKNYARDRMAGLIKRKAFAARTAHPGVRLGGKSLNELFDDEPSVLMDALVNDPEGWVNPANARESRFFTELVSATGPMYKVFTPVELDVVLDWIESLKEEAAPIPTPDDPGSEMRRVLSRYADRARMEPLHREYSLPAADGTSKTVQEWFEGPLEDLMAALARSEWVTPGSVEQSTFFTDVIGPEGLMAGVIAATDVEVIKKWVTAGCPLPGAAPGPAAVASLIAASLTEAPDVPFTKRRLVIGMGTVH